MRIESVKLGFKDKAQAKIGSLDNAHHVPGGGNVMVSELGLEDLIYSCITGFILYKSFYFFIFVNAEFLFFFLTHFKHAPHELLGLTH